MKSVVGVNEGGGDVRGSGEPKQQSSRVAYDRIHSGSDTICCLDGSGRVGCFRTHQFEGVVTDLRPLTECSRDGFELLDASISNRAFTESFLRAKVDGCCRTLQLLHHVRDPRARFDMPQICASACLLNHAFPLANLQYAVSAADDFDALQRASYTELHCIALSDTAWAPATLPIRLGGHGFTLTHPFPHGAAAASIIDAAPGRERAAAYTKPGSSAPFGLRYRGGRSFLIRQALTLLRDFLLLVPGHPYSQTPRRTPKVILGEGSAAKHTWKRLPRLFSLHLVLWSVERPTRCGR